VSRFIIASIVEKRETAMGHGKNASGSKKIVRAPATKFAHLQKKALKNRKPKEQKRGKGT
jgi:hypothetical protein